MDHQAKRAREFTQLAYAHRAVHETVAKIAAEAGVSESTIRRWMDRHGLSPAKASGSSPAGGSSEDAAAQDAAVQDALKAETAERLENTRSDIRSSLERLCAAVFPMDNVKYGIYGKDTIDFDQLRDACALADYCVDTDSWSYNKDSAEALATLGHYAQIEKDAKELWEHEDIRVRRAVKFALDESVKNFGPLREAVAAAKRHMMDVKAYVADYIADRLNDSDLEPISDEAEAQAAAAAMFKKTLVAAREAFRQNYGDEDPWMAEGWLALHSVFRTNAANQIDDIGS